MKKCPACGASVKLENLERHVRNQHPRDGVDLSGLITVRERRQVERSAASRHRRTVTPGGRRLALVAAVLIAAIVALVIWNPFRTGVWVGEVAPDFRLTTSDDRPFTLSDTRGAPVLLVFMDCDCPHCENEAKYVLRFVHVNYSGAVQFVSVSVDFYMDSDTPERISAKKEEWHTPWTYVRDEGQRVSSRYGAPPTPLSFVLDPAGKVVWRLEGQAPDGYETYRVALDHALALQPAPPLCGSR